MVSYPSFFNLCQTFPFKRFQNPKMFAGFVTEIFLSSIWGKNDYTTTIYIFG